MNGFASQRSIDKLHTFLASLDQDESLQQSFDSLQISACTAQLLGIHSKQEYTSNKSESNGHFVLSSKQAAAVNAIDALHEDLDVDIKPKTKHLEWQNIGQSKWYIPPRDGVDDALDLFFQRSDHGDLNKANLCKTYEKSERPLVCEKCAGYHRKDECTSDVFTCHMCGAAGHRMFECKRVKCIICLQVGHLAYHCSAHTT